MEKYQVPIEDMLFGLTNLIDIDKFSKEIKNPDASSENIKIIIEEAGKFAAKELDSINHEGDQEGVKLENGIVRMPTSFINAYKNFINNGWFSVIGEKKYGGQNLPWASIVVINEIWQSTNMSFALNNLLSQGAIELIEQHGTDKQKEQYQSYLDNEASWKISTRI